MKQALAKVVVGTQLIKQISHNTIIDTSKYIHYVTEHKDWVVVWEAEQLKEFIPNIRIVQTVTGVSNSIVHFGSFHTITSIDMLKNIKEKNNKIILTWYHIPPKEDIKIDVKKANPYLDIVHTSCHTTKKKMVEMGISANKIVVIPIPVDKTRFNPLTPSQIKELRAELDIPENAFLVGSFQKDGIGWGDGNEPKLIKGPDIFCDTIIEAAPKIKNLHVLLIGPARGYIINRLKKAGVPYTHTIKPYDEIHKYYAILSAYLISARVEGGPKSVLESMATGVPVVSTHVGMATDLIEHGKNGWLCATDAHELAQQLIEASKNPDAIKNITKEGLAVAAKYSWEGSYPSFKELYDSLGK